MFFKLSFQWVARLSLVCTLAAFMSIAHGQEGGSAKLLRDTDLRADKLASAAVVRALPQGSNVQLLSLEGGWAWVKSSAGAATNPAATGWVRASNLDLAPGSSHFSMLKTGREATGSVNAALTLGVRSLPPRANRHALIITVGEYALPTISALPGTRHDRDSALQMAQAMDIPLENIHFLSNKEATGQGIRQALRGLDSRVKTGDRVFVYYAGHGTRYFDKELNACVEALMTYDGSFEGMVSNKELAKLLQPITAKTDKLFVMYDACHSGGLLAQAPSRPASRALLAAGDDEDNSTIRARFSNVMEQCAVTANIQTRSYNAEQYKLGALPQDIIHLSSTRANEASFEDAEKGGFATQYVRDCMLREAKDLDRSGAVSVKEIAQCAQQKINARLRGVPDLKAHNLEISGNANFIPSWFNQAPSLNTGNASAVAAPATTPYTAPPKTSGSATALQKPTSNTPANTSSNTPSSGSETAFSGEQALRQIYDQRDAKRRVQVMLSQDKLKIGKDFLDMTVQSSHGGYVYVALAGSDNQSLYLLFPNSLDQNNRIEALQQLSLPRPTWRVRSEGPAGKNTLMVIVSDRPRNLQQLELAANRAGPFIKSLNNPQGRSQLGQFMALSAGGDSKTCKNSANGACSDAYGAAMAYVIED